MHVKKTMPVWACIPKHMHVRIYRNVDNLERVKAAVEESGGLMCVCVCCMHV